MPTHCGHFAGDAFSTRGFANGGLRLRFFISRRVKTEESDANGGLSCGTLRERLRTVEI
ncbi:hypothetical protein [Nostoc sp.]|uniref:hypothetical protein n=1 Tax=Nostoc sp. TaxID=1180 RepID=UPI002FF8CDCC